MEGLEREEFKVGGIRKEKIAEQGFEGICFSHSATCIVALLI